MKKIGFTLAESLITMVIIAVLTASAVHIFKTYDKSIKYLYSNIYYVLDRAWYNSSTYWITLNSEARDPFRRNADTNEFEVEDLNEAAQMLCQALIEYINPLDRVNSCTANAIDASGSADLFTEENVQFTATNGMRFWISERYPNDPGQSNFFIVYADLNGKKLPNSMEYEIGEGANIKKTKDPDIFAFAVLDSQRVCPLGVPEVDTRYMSARIMYEDENAQSRLTQKSIPYIIAKAEAWGYYTSNIANDPDDLFIIDEAPLSYNDYIKGVILDNSSDSKIYSFLNGSTMKNFYQDKFASTTCDTSEPSDDSDDSDDSDNSEEPGGSDFAINQTLSCNGKSIEHCDVIVDKYTY